MYTCSDNIIVLFSQFFYAPKCIRKNILKLAFFLIYVIFSVNMTDFFEVSFEV